MRHRSSTFLYNLFFLLAVMTIGVGACFLLMADGDTRLLGAVGSVVAFIAFALATDRYRH